MELLELKKLSTDKDKVEVDENQAKKDFQALVKEGEEDQALKEKILKELEIPEAPSFTVPNLNLNQRQDANLQFANAGAGSNTVINNVIGGSQQNVASNSASINNLSGSGNIDKTYINLQTVPI